MSIRGEFEQMVKEGLLVPTGEMRRNSKGELEPVYVLREGAKAIGLPLPPLRCPTDSNLYVLEVRHGVILYLNARTPVEDGWWWGTDDTSA